MALEQLLQGRFDWDGRVRLPQDLSAQAARTTRNLDRLHENTSRIEVSSGDEIDNNDVMQNATICAYFAELAYRKDNGPESIRQYVGEAEARDVYQFFDDGTHTQAFGIAGEKSVVIAFRGTQYDVMLDAVVDWTHNFEVNLTPFDEGDERGAQVHAGFIGHDGRGVRGVWRQLSAFLKKHRGKSVHFTGHSLGGAQATLAACKFAQESANDQSIAVYTFGSPMVGDPQFEEEYVRCGVDRNTFRFTNANDVVPRAPYSATPVLDWIEDHLPRWLFLIAVVLGGLVRVLSPFTTPGSHDEYMHVGRHYHIEADGYTINTRANNQFEPETGRKRWRMFNRLGDHRHKAYYLAVRNNVVGGTDAPDIIDTLSPGSWRHSEGSFFGYYYNKFTNRFLYPDHPHHE